MLFKHHHRAAWLAAAVVACAAATGDMDILRPSDRRNQHGFGWGVAISGDTLLAGAPEHDGEANNAGSAYIFTWDGSEWSETQQLAIPNAYSGREVGKYVALDLDTAVITSSPSFYVYTRTGTAWTLQAEETDENQTSFGRSVAISGDTIIVGSFGYANVYVRAGSVWTREAQLRPSSIEWVDNFGWAVDIDGDTAAVGAPIRHNHRGSVWIFTRSGTTWSPGVELLVQDFFAREELGYAVSIDGDSVLAGAPHNQFGRAYVFSRNPATDVWSEESKLTPADDVTFVDFATSVALEGNVAVVGAHDDVNYPNSKNNGAGYTFWRHVYGQWTQSEKLVINVSGYEPRNDRVGRNVAIDNGICVLSADGYKTREGAVLVVNTNTEVRETWTTTHTTTSTITVTSLTSTSTTSSTVTTTTETSTTQTTTSTSSSTSSLSTTTETSTSTVTTMSETSSTTTSSTTTSTVSTTTATTTTETSTSRTSTSTATTTTMTSTSTTTTSSTTSSSTVTTTSVTSTSTTSTVSSTSTQTTTTETTTSTLSSTTKSSTTTSTTTTVTSSSTVSTTTETSTSSSTTTSSSTVSTTSETSSTSTSTSTATTETSSTTSSTSSTTTVTTTTETTTSQTSTSSSSVTTRTITITSSSTTTSTETTTTATSTTATSTTTTVTGERAKTMQGLQAQIGEAEQAALQDLIASGEDIIEARGVINAGPTIAAKATPSKMHFEIPYEESITAEVTVPRIVLQDLRAGYVLISLVAEQTMVAISDRRATVLGHMLSVTFYDEDAVKLEARSLRKAVEIKMPSLDLNVSACGWYDNASDAWSNYRLRTMDGEDDGLLRCATFHTTLFANVAAPEWRVVEAVNEGSHELLYPASLFFGFQVTLYILLFVTRSSRHRGEWQIEYIENAAAAAPAKLAWSEDVKRPSRSGSLRGGWEGKMVRHCASHLMAFHCRVCDTDCARFLEAHKNRDPLLLGLPAKSHHPAFNPFWNAPLHKRTWILFFAFQPICRIRRLTTKQAFWVFVDFLAVPFVSFAPTSVLVAALLWMFFGTIDSAADPDPAVLGISALLGVASLALAVALVRMARSATASRIDSKLMRACALFALGGCLASTCLTLYNMSARAGLYWLAAAFTDSLCWNLAVPMLKALYYAFHAGRAYRAAPDLVLSTYKNLYALKAESGEPPVHVWDCSHHTDGGKLKEQECIKDFSPIFMAWGLGARVDSARPESPDDDEEDGDFTPIMCTNKGNLKSLSDSGGASFSEASRPTTQPELEPDIVVHSLEPKIVLNNSNSRESVGRSITDKSFGASRSIMEWGRPHEAATAPLGASQIALDWKPGASLELHGIHEGRAMTAGSERAPTAGSSPWRGHTASSSRPAPLGQAAEELSEVGAPSSFLTPLAATSVPHGASFGSLAVSPVADLSDKVRRDSVHSLDTEVLGSDRDTPVAEEDAEEPGREPDDDDEHVESDDDDDDDFDPGEMVLEEHASSRPSRSGSSASSRGSSFSLPLAEDDDDDDDDPRGTRRDSGTATGLWQEYARQR